MGDLLCRVCGEPWDAWGVHHGDMMAWEAKLFKSGAGCPYCKGETPEGIDSEELEVESARSMFDNWDDPHSFEHVDNVLASAVTGKMPARKKWKEPAREVVWTCEGCQAQAVRPLQFSLCEPNTGENAELEWANGEKVHYSHGLAFARGDALDRNEPDDGPFVVDGKTYCDLCAGCCDAPGCVTVVFRRSDLDPGDPYRPGASFMSTGNVGSYGDTLCIECYERDSSNEEESEDG